MNASALQQAIPVRPAWRMPVCPERYDRSPLSAAERAALEVLISGDAPVNSLARRRAEATLARLTQPLHNVYRLRRAEASTRPRATCVMFAQMHRRGTAFWQWSAQEWCDVVGVTAESFEAANGLPQLRNGLRPHLLDVAYLLCGFEQFGPIWTATAFYPMARVVFGADVLDEQIARLDAVLANDGYASGHVSVKQRHQALAFLLLLNRSPWLEDLCWAALERAASMASTRAASIILGKIARALVRLGILAPSADAAARDPFPLGPSDGVPNEWYAWYRAWRATGSRGLAPRVARHYGGYILYAGRWLARRHPHVVAPDQWTEELALAMRTAVLEETNDVFVSASGRKNLQRRGQLGRRFGHAAISQFLASLRRFFRDLQTKAHAVGDEPARRIPRRFDPREALATPEHVEKALAGSEPRDIALAVWQRLAIQAARLKPEDLGPLSYWPFSAVQALAFLWVSTARRPNELLRLRADCVRTQWEPDMRDEAGDRLPPCADVVGDERGAKISYLHVPSSTDGGPRWIWILLEVSFRHIERPGRRAALNQLLGGPEAKDYADAFCFALDADEARAEKVRAPFTRREIRDFYDLAACLTLVPILFPPNSSHSSTQNSPRTPPSFLSSSRLVLG